MVIMAFGEVLKSLREECGVTQDKLAQYLHVNRATIAGYEVKGKEPRYETLIKLADYFDVSLDDYLVTGEENRLGIQK